MHGQPASTSRSKKLVLCKFNGSHPIRIENSRKMLYRFGIGMTVTGGFIAEDELMPEMVWLLFFL